MATREPASRGSANNIGRTEQSVLNREPSYLINRGGAIGRAQNPERNYAPGDRLNAGGKPLGSYTAPGTVVGFKNYERPGDERWSGVVVEDMPTDVTTGGGHRFVTTADGFVNVRVDSGNGNYHFNRIRKTYLVSL